MKTPALLMMALLLLLQTACRPFTDKDQRLIASAKAGGAARVEGLLKRGADVNAREKNGQLTQMRFTALMWAADKGHGDVVELLIAAKADVNAEDSGKRTALMMAASRGYMEIARRLVEAGGDIHAKAYGDDTILLAAARGGHAPVVRWFLEQGAGADEANDLGETPFMAAAMRGHIEAAEYLLASGAEVDARDNMGSTALILAAAGVLHEAGGHPAMVRFLLDNSTDINAAEDDSRMGHR
jgi:uncharacterized protein